MGIIPPGERGQDCLLCYLAFETPKQIIMSVTGIKTGNDWNPGDPSPPNVGIVLTQHAVDACRWEATPPNRNFVVARVPGQSQFSIQAFNPFMWIFKKIGAQCMNFAENQFDVPAGNKFYGGSIQLWTV